MSIGKRIAEIRKSKKITQQELSSKSGVDYNTLRKIETEKTKNPSPEFIEKIANVLGIEAARLLADPRPNIQGGDILPFDELSPERFEQLVVWILEMHDGFDEIETYGGRGDKKRDILAKKVIGGKKAEKATLFQVKRYQKTDSTMLINELVGIKKYFFDIPNPSTPIDSIIFCLADSPSPTIKDKVKDYAFSNSLPEPLFWEARDLDVLCKKQPQIINEFFGGHFEEIKESIASLDDKADDIKTTLERIESCVISVTPADDAEMQWARRLIADEKYSEAEEILLSLRKIIEKGGDNERLKKLYNNLGLCFSRTQSTDMTKSIEMLKKALSIDETFVAPKQNLVGIIINSAIKEEYNYALKLGKELIDTDKKNPEYISLYLHALSANDKLKEAVGLIEENGGLREEIDKNENLSVSVVFIYLRLEDTKNAAYYVDKGLKNFPESVRLNRFKGSILMEEAKMRGIGYLDHKLLPFFPELDLVEEAVKYFEKALSFAENSSQPNYIKDQLRFHVYTTRALLHEGKEKNFKILQKIEEDIVEENLSQDEKRNKTIVEISLKLSERKFQDAYNLVQNFIRNYNLKYEDVILMAKKFLWHGSPEFVIKLISPLIDEAKENKDFEYWALMSTCFALIGDKNSSLRVMNEAKSYFLSNDQAVYKRLLSHYGGIVGRYRDNGESDRLMHNMFELQRIVPEETILTPIKAIDDDGQISTEFQEIIKNAKNAFEKKREIFKSNPIPVYFLTNEKIFGRSLPEVIEIPRDNYDFAFTLPYNTLDKDFLERQKKHFQESDVFVLDYSALLNFARTGQLGLFRALGKRAVISESLLFKVQNDLMSCEMQALREAWNFIRSDEVELIPFREVKPESFEKMKEFLDQWLIQEMDYCVKEEAILLTDDLRLLHYVHSLEVGGKAVNSFIFFQEGLNLGAIDKRQFSLVLAELADIFYQFIPYNGEDLSNIVSDDNLSVRGQSIGWLKFPMATGEFKISRRVYHLLNQIKLPGSDATSFLSVCSDFITRLVRQGIPEEEKVDWVVFLTNFFDEYVSQDNFKVDYELAKSHLGLIVDLWLILSKALPLGSRGLIFSEAEGIKNEKLKRGIINSLRHYFPEDGKSNS